MDDVERVARQLEHMFCGIGWDDLPSDAHDEWRSQAREVLAALHKTDDEEQP